MQSGRHGERPNYVSVHVTMRNGTTVVALVGDLDVSTAGSVIGRLRPLARRGPVELDLSKIDFIDATGLRALRDATAIALEHGHHIAVSGRVSRAVGALVDALGFDVATMLTA